MHNKAETNPGNPGDGCDLQIIPARPLESKSSLLFKCKSIRVTT